MFSSSFSGLKNRSKRDDSKSYDVKSVRDEMCYTRRWHSSTLSLTRHIGAKRKFSLRLKRNNLPSMYRQSVVHCRIFGSSVKRRVRALAPNPQITPKKCSLSRSRHLQLHPLQPEQHSNKHRGRMEKKQPQTMCILHSSPHHNSAIGRKKIYRKFSPRFRKARKKRLIDKFINN